MKINLFKGDFFEIGKQQGKIYHKNGMNFTNLKITPTLYEKQLLAYKRYYPELLEEFEGMAVAGKFDENKLIYNFICGGLLQFKKQWKSCTIFGVKNKNGTFVGRNYDWHPVTEKVFEVYKVENKSRNSFIGISDMGIDGPATAKPKYLYYDADDTINDKGLFIGLTFAFNNKWNYGLVCTHMIKLIAETCKTVDDALDVFRRVPISYPKNFFISDRNGDMAVVEHTSKRFKIVYPKDNVLVQTNHYVDPELAREDLVLKKIPTHNTFLRYYEAWQKINEHKDKFKQADAIKILGNIQSCICQNHSNMKTVWSLGLDMRKSKYELYWDVTGQRKEMNLNI